MAPTSTLPDNPVYAFCPEYGPPNGPQQIRIVFRDIPGLRADRPGCAHPRGCRKSVLQAQRFARTGPRRLAGPRRPVHGRRRAPRQFQRALRPFSASEWKSL